MNHAQKFIEQMKIDQEKNDSEMYENIVIRVDQKYAAMIAVLGALFKFPASTAFSDLFSKHLFDMAVAMDEERYAKVMARVLETLPENYQSSARIDKKSIDGLIDEEYQERFGSFLASLDK